MNTVASQALHNQAEAARYKLGADRHNRRLGGTSKPERQDNRTKEAKRMDQIALEHESAIMLTPENRTLNIVEQAVKIAYATGSTQLNDNERKALALVAFNMGLDPSPGVGHLYAWKQGNQFFVQIGYQGWIFKAQQKYQFVYEVREMSDAERNAHGLTAGDIGAICDLYESGRADQWHKMGLEPRPVKGFGVLRASNDAVPPKGRTKLWVAMKRATTDALKHLGLGFGPMLIQPVDGMQYDPEMEGYISIIGGDADGDPEMAGAMQGDFEDGIIDGTPETVINTDSISALKAKITSTKPSGKTIDTEKYIGQFVGICSEHAAKTFTVLVAGVKSLAEVDRTHGKLIADWLKETTNPGVIIAAWLDEPMDVIAPESADPAPETETING